MAKQSFSVGQVLTAAQMTSLQQTAMGGGSPSVKTASYTLVAADAGTVIQVNSTSATTITVNTGLFAAGDSVQIQNIGSGTTTITAGTATVNSAGSLGVTQYDGGFLYFSTASFAIWFDYTQAGTTLPLTTKGDLFGYSTTNARVPIGTNGQVLTADSTEALGLKWATAGGGGANYSLLNAGGTSLSGSTVTVSGISGMDKLIVLVRAGSSTGTSDFAIQLNGDTGTNYGQWGLAMNTYNLPATYIKVSVAGAFEGYGNNPTSLTTNKWNFAAPGDADGQVNMFMRIEGCNSSGAKFMQQSSGASTAGVAPQNLMNQTGGIYTGSSTISSVTISCGSSPTFDGGTIYIYGSA
jgi:hypothetical protein